MCSFHLYFQFVLRTSELSPLVSKRQVWPLGVRCWGNWNVNKSDFTLKNLCPSHFFFLWVPQREKQKQMAVQVLTSAQGVCRSSLAWGSCWGGALGRVGGSVFFKDGPAHGEPDTSRPPGPCSAHQQPQQCHFLTPSAPVSPLQHTAITALLKVSEPAGCSHPSAQSGRPVLLEPAGAMQAWHGRGSPHTVLILMVPRAHAHFLLLQKTSSAPHRLPRRLRVISKTCVGQTGMAPAGPEVTSHTKVDTKNTLLKTIVEECGSESLLSHHPVGYMGLIRRLYSSSSLKV